MINPAGQAIESESFRIIRAEMGQHVFSPEQEVLVVRVIHATADFDFAHILRFSPGAVEAGVEALRAGHPIVSDVRMIEVGVSGLLLKQVGGTIHCAIGDETVYARAEREGTTRAAAAMRELAPHIDGGIVAIGNAPTALLEVIRLIHEEGIHPALVVGVPVGFVSAVESKDELAGLDIPHITALGRKGGSTVAVAILNALLRLAVES
jgi:precorrin-8X/cobalt-precorrin-8 methylmutase